MFDIFQPMTPDERRSQHAAYSQYLAQRDGVFDVKKRTLSHREKGMERFARKLSKLRDIDHFEFKKQYTKFDPKRETSREMLLLLALVKLNGTEAYGVNRVYEQASKSALRGEGDVELRVLLQETYHTRILLSSAMLYGIQIDAPQQPSLTLRMYMSGIAHGPEAVKRPLLLTGEAMGALIFLDLLDAARDILRHDAELRDAIEERIMEVLTDEIGHTSYNRLMLGPAGIARARWLLPVLVKYFAETVPELRSLGAPLTVAGVSAVTTSPRIPEAVRKAAFVA